ncbi:UNKNOWN [Stylonychia lemnae]|uniref:Uncharacterized protein n=1 Tax=Stylonychia lemnae TaxID=5949 RepID=A0A078AZU1_STYLE|nr:UNKNOWN [Stylonychia lemnae]|eukprot:CDW87744.1 UNKNOWN [Stylonychia lemnae]
MLEQDEKDDIEDQDKEQTSVNDNPIQKQQQISQKPSQSNTDEQTQSLGKTPEDSYYESTQTTSQQYSPQYQMIKDMMQYSCVDNQECIDTTFCCSTQKCAHPSVCLHGQKLYQDYCDYNFECMSRCCHDRQCAHFLECYDTCTVNSDCRFTSCCTEGYCSSQVVCEGNKMAGDVCEQSSECISQYCFNSKCQVQPEDFPSWAWGIIIMAVVGSLLFMLYGYCTLKYRHNRSKEDIYAALEHFAEMREHKQPLLQDHQPDASHVLVVQSVSRKFLYNNPKKMPHLPIDMRYHATPIQEVKSEYQYYTYDDRNPKLFNSASESSLNMNSVELTQRRDSDDDPQNQANNIRNKWTNSLKQSFTSDSQPHNQNRQNRTSQVQNNNNMLIPSPRPTQSISKSPTIQIDDSYKIFDIQQQIYRFNQLEQCKVEQPQSILKQSTMRSKLQVDNQKSDVIQKSQKKLQIKVPESESDSREETKTRQTISNLIDQQILLSHQSESKDSQEEEVQQNVPQFKQSQTIKLPKKTEFAEDDFLQAFINDFKPRSPIESDKNQMLGSNTGLYQKQKSKIFIEDQQEIKGGELLDEDGYHESDESEGKSKMSIQHKKNA